MESVGILTNLRAKFGGCKVFLLNKTEKNVQKISFEYNLKQPFYCVYGTDKY